MAAAELVFSLVAAFFFLAIGLEELPLRFNVERVKRQVRRSSRRRGEPPLARLEKLRISTRRSVAVLIAFAVSSALLLAYVRATQAPGARLATAVQAFGGTCVLGLFFLAYAFWAWAPRLMERVEREIQAETAGSNANAPFESAKDPNGHDP